MAYIESFLLYILVLLFIYMITFGVFVLFYMFYGYFRLTYAHENVTKDIYKNYLYKLIKNRYYKLLTALYIVIFAFFYISNFMNYTGKDSAYSKAKSYAVVADAVYLWHTIGINIHMETGFQKYARLINPEGLLDTGVQNFQSFLLSRMYQYIPKDDGEREFWYYKYKQLYMVKIRYRPDSSYNPHPRFEKIMNKMYDTSYKLYDKPFKDKNIDNQKYIFIGQMSYYLTSNMAYYATYDKMNYLKKLFMFIDNKKLFQRNIDYANLLNKVYKKYKTDKELKKEFDKHPYNLGLFYAGLLRVYNNNIVYNSHNDINPCTSKEIKIFTNLVEDFYSWVFREKNSSFYDLSEREQKQIKWLYRATALSFSYRVATYLCEIPLKYKDSRRLKKVHDYRILPIYKNNYEFMHKSSVTTDNFIEFSKLENLLEEKELKNQITNQKDK